MVVAGLQVRAQAQANRSETEKLIFQHEIITCVPTQNIWDEFVVALQESERSTIWPSELSSVKGTAALNAELRVTYGSGWFSPTYRYLLTLFSPGIFRYEATGNHPFQGGATVTVSVFENQTRIYWDGLYHVARGDSFAKRYFSDFSPKFFRSLDERVQILEERFC